MELVAYITQPYNVAVFLLLLARFGGVFAFFPFFDNQLISINVRAAMVFFMSVAFFPLASASLPDMTMVEFLIAALFEVMLGFIASICLQIVFAMLSFGGELISFTMGLTMASAYDPVSGTQKPIIAQLIAILGLLIALSLDFHHTIFLIISHSLNATPLGSFVFEPKSVAYFVKAFGNVFAVGFSMAFPVLAIILFSDVIFGMIMKTHPQFNLLAIGFPVKIAIAFVVLILTISTIIYTFKNELREAFIAVGKLFFGQ
ncbi:MULTISPECIES: flagellar biosynthetic protein FliR [Helicobacter]|uniref:Flagellar biosynthetic protein FliR n=1 Tax=Helicobacter typhlonius TaxID=76936 RepID=A0A099UG04_9HELI|nr:MULTISPECIES: flagellar biosynthetic protein FliR [Helicobacter]TLD78792.1 flagellar type III secretion system protein FliR [Helicobacter typhlonius]TLD90127.1 flagellar type III secretion system protein FliR [Helicobacter sp. MIT 03-1616]CUU40783.1 Flagellar biosynthesis protein FliR [Helicobacter typhlonius]